MTWDIYIYIYGKLIGLHQSGSTNHAVLLSLVSIWLCRILKYIYIAELMALNSMLHIDKGSLIGLFYKTVLQLANWQIYSIWNIWKISFSPKKICAWSEVLKIPLLHVCNRRIYTCMQICSPLCKNHTNSPKLWHCNIKILTSLSKSGCYLMSEGFSE